MSVRNARSTNQWMTLTDNTMVNKKIASAADSSFSWSLLSVAVDIKTNFQTVQQLVGLRKYLAAPAGLLIKRGTQVDHQQSLIELTPDAQHAAEFSIPKPTSNASNPASTGLLIPTRVGPFNARWTVGLYQLAGYTLGYYGGGEKRYSTLGLDDAGFAYVPIYAGRAPLTHVVAGCPVTAIGQGSEELFIQVTHVDENPQIWHVEINNPTVKVVTASFQASMNLPGMIAPSASPVTIAPGGFVVL